MMIGGKGKSFQIQEGRTQEEGKTLFEGENAQLNHIYSTFAQHTYALISLLG